MTECQLKEYRKILEKEFSDKDLEIESSLTYISVGALGFFITINDKFLKLQEAKFSALLIISLIFLFISFILILIRKSKTMRHSLDMMTLIDGFSHVNDNQDEVSVCQDRELLKLWDSCHKKLTQIRTYTYFSLSIGIGLQILFLILNVK